MNTNSFLDLPTDPALSTLVNMLNTRDSLSHYKFTNDWLFGFFEAEAELRVKPNNIGIIVEQHSSDYFFMVALKNFIGAGNLFFVEHKSSVVLRYTLYGKDNIEKFFLPRFSTGLLGASDLQSKKDVPLRLNRWIQEWFPDYFSTNIPRLKLNENWLAGFTDGAGSFYNKMRQAKDYRIGFQWRVVYDLTQQISLKDQTRNNIFQQIQNQFFLSAKSNLYMQKSDKGKNKSHIRNETPASLIKNVIPIFDQYKLQSRKEIQYWLWKHAVFFIEKNEHLLPENKEKIESYRKVCNAFSNKFSIQTQKIVYQNMRLF